MTSAKQISEKPWTYRQVKIQTESLLLPFTQTSHFYSIFIHKLSQDVTQAVSEISGLGVQDTCKLQLLNLTDTVYKTAHNSNGTWWHVGSEFSHQYKDYKVFCEVTKCTNGRWLSTFWRNLLPPFSGQKKNKGRQQHPSIKKWAVHLSEVLVPIFWTRWHHIAQDHDHNDKNIYTSRLKILHT